MTDPNATDAHGHSGPSSDHDQNADDDGETHGHDDHAEPDLGSIDVAAWGAGALGIAIAVVIAACFALATSGIG